MKVSLEGLVKKSDYYLNIPLLEDFGLTGEKFRYIKKKSWYVKKIFQITVGSFCLLLFGGFNYLQYNSIDTIYEYSQNLFGYIVILTTVGSGIIIIKVWIGLNKWFNKDFLNLFFIDNYRNFRDYSLSIINHNKEFQEKRLQVERDLKEKEYLEKLKVEKYWLSQSGREFEISVKDLFLKLGHSVKLTKGSGDKGVDIFLDDDTIIQCKNTKSPSSPSVVRDLLGTMTHFNKQKGIVISTGGFTSGCYEFSEGKKIELWDLDKIIEISNSLEYILQKKELDYDLRIK